MRSGVQALLLTTAVSAASDIIIDKQQASNFINDHARQKRENSGLYEESMDVNLIRECVEESCDLNEAQEIFDHFEERDIRDFYRNTNVDRPIPADAQSMAIDFLSMARQPCTFYHSSYQKGANTKLCSSYGGTCRNIGWLEKTCECLKLDGKYITAGDYCEGCHMNCIGNKGQCLRERNNAGVRCRCNDARVTNGVKTEVLVGEPAWTDSESAFCDVPLDFCRMRTDRCDRVSTGVRVVHCFARFFF